MHAQGDFAGRRRGEEQRGFAAETEVLRALADIEGQRGLALSGIARIERDETILEAQAAQGGLERRLVEGLEIQPADRLP